LLDQVIHSLIRFEFLGNVAVNPPFVSPSPAAVSAFNELASSNKPPRTLDFQLAGSYLISSAVWHIFIFHNHSFVEMTGKFSTKDVLRCDHYARFMSHLTLPQANAVFWLLFFFVRSSS
jgi:hypothetical protein